MTDTALNIKKQPYPGHYSKNCRRLLNKSNRVEGSPCSTSAKGAYSVHLSSRCSSGSRAFGFQIGRICCAHTPLPGSGVYKTPRTTLVSLATPTDHLAITTGRPGQFHFIFKWSKLILMDICRLCK